MAQAFKKTRFPSKNGNEKRSCATFTSSQKGTSSSLCTKKDKVVLGVCIL